MRRPVAGPCLREAASAVTTLYPEKPIRKVAATALEEDSNPLGKLQSNWTSPTGARRAVRAAGVRGMVKGHPDARSSCREVPPRAPATPSGGSRFRLRS